jgi:hypothetical protein
MGQAVSFRTIWDNYPTSDPCIDTKTGKPPPGYDNQCAIRVGYALEKSGVSFASFGGARCPVSSRTSGLASSAQALANWLKTRPFAGCPIVDTFEGQTVFSKIADRTGIIFLADYWQRAGETGKQRSGDHIDLWNGSRMTSVSSWLRVHWGVSWDGLWSDFRGAPRVLFWHIP